MAGQLRALIVDIDRAWPGTGVVKRLWYILIEPGTTAVFLVRLQIFLETNRLLPISKLVRAHNHALTGLDWVPGARAGGGLVIRHPSGIVVGYRTQIGENATILQHVTFGQKSIGTDVTSHQYPTVGNNVIVGAGAIILGGITLGDDCVIGANSVVLADVEAGSTVAGSPARAVGQTCKRKIKIELD